MTTMAGETNGGTSSKPLVIFVPGLYCSTLTCRKSRQKKWNLPTSLLWSVVRGNRGHDSLALPITWSKDEHGKSKQDEDDIEVSDCEYMPQSKILDFLDGLYEHKLIDLHKIPWDWRRGLEETEETVNKKLQEICSGDARQANLITFSTGATVSWPTVNSCPELFSSWISVAGCTMGSNYFLKELRYGWKTPGIEFATLLGKETLFTFPSHVSYFKVAEEDFSGTGESDFISHCDGGMKFANETDINLFSVNDWENFKLGIFGWKKEVSEGERSHLAHSLASAKRFREKHYSRGENPRHSDAFLERERKDYDHIDITCYGSDSFSSHSAYAVELSKKTVDVSCSNLTAPGDKTLWSVDWKSLPGGLNVRIAFAEEGSTHSNMLNDQKLLDVIAQQLFGNEEECMLGGLDFRRQAQKEITEVRVVYACAAILAIIAILRV